MLKASLIYFSIGRFHFINIIHCIIQTYFPIGHFCIKPKIWGRKFVEHLVDLSSYAFISTNAKTIWRVMLRPICRVLSTCPVKCWWYILRRRFVKHLIDTKKKVMYQIFKELSHAFFLPFRRSGNHTGSYVDSIANEIWRKLVFLFYKFLPSQSSIMFGSLGTIEFSILPCLIMFRNGWSATIIYLISHIFINKIGTKGKAGGFMV